MPKRLRTVCPHCQRFNDLHDEKDPTRAPQTGDVSICFGCAQFAVFGPESADKRLPLVLRKPTPEELQDIMSDQNAVRDQELVRRFSTPQEAIAYMRQQEDEDV